MSVTPNNPTIAKAPPADYFYLTNELTTQKELATMLTLIRENDQKILIGDHITVTVMITQTGEVKLGIDTPKDVSIIRPDAEMLTM
jgi:carbon storage regulator CsrA